MTRWWALLVVFYDWLMEGLDDLVKVLLVVVFVGIAVSLVVEWKCDPVLYFDKSGGEVYRCR